MEYLPTNLGHYWGKCMEMYGIFTYKTGSLLGYMYGNVWNMYVQDWVIIGVKFMEYLPAKLGRYWGKCMEYLPTKLGHYWGIYM